MTTPSTPTPDPSGHQPTTAHALIGRVRLKPGRADEAQAMIRDHGEAMVAGMPGATAGFWARSSDGDGIQHSFWLFDTEEHARMAEATFTLLRDMPDAPATFVSADVCEVLGQASPTASQGLN